MTGESLEERRRQILATHEIVHRIGCSCRGPSEAVGIVDLLRQARREGAESVMEDWICESCRTVRPFAQVNRGVKSVVCPGCGGISFMPLCLYEKRIARREGAEWMRERAAILFEPGDGFVLNVSRRIRALEPEAKP